RWASTSAVSSAGAFMSLVSSCVSPILLWLQAVLFQGPRGDAAAPENASSSRPREDLARVHQIARVECVLDGAHGVDGDIAVFFQQEAHLVQPNPMLAGAGAVHAQRALHDAVIQALGFFEFFRLV